MYSVICRAYNSHGHMVLQEMYNSASTASAYLVFTKELKQISDYADQTVRITMDIALPDRWYDVKEP